MKPADYLAGCFLLLAVVVDIVQPTCVLESDFGFKINCAFKKSGLFRVRNLGGLKAHASIGFSLGDELGFEQSLTNQDPSRRRSVSVKSGAPPNLIADTSARPAAKQEKRGRIMMRPSVPGNRPNQQAMDRLTSLHRRASTTMQPIFVNHPTVDLPVTVPKTQQPQKATIAKPYPMGVPAFKPLPPKDDSLHVIPIAVSTRKTYTPLQVPQSKGPALAYTNPVPHHVHELATQLYPSYNTKKVDDYNSITGYGDDTTLRFNKDEINEKIAEIAKAGNISMEAVEAAIALRQQQLLNKYASVQVPTTTTTTTTSTTTQAPFVFEPEPEPVVAVPSKPKRAPTSGKVMNAPREYYPVGYEKNFDDQFQSKVDLPDTNFHCGDQKYFPGLYGDENLGCMVFHVCALTDDGLVMKSFLCPESTLFDQTILKCNWWFYVDCKSTRKLYDTNIPVSKSYQLMKALTFFSSYKKDMQNGEQQTNPDEMEGVKEAITILGNQDDSKRSQTIQIVTPQPTLNTDTNNFTPVYRANRNYKNSTRDVNNSRDKQKSDTDDIQTASSEIRLVKVSADMNFNKAAQSFGSVETVTKTTSSESSSRERQYKRKPTLRKSTVNTSRTTSISTTITTSTPTTVNTTTVQPNVILSNPIFEVVKQEIQPIEQFNQQLPQHQTDVTQEKLTDQIDSADNIEPDSEKLPPVRRFYRSSAEAHSKEMTMVNNEQIQIVRPTSYAKLVGEFQTPTATIAKLDEAILGRFKPITTKREASRRQRRSTNRNRT